MKQEETIEVEVKLLRTVWPIYVTKCQELGSGLREAPKGPPQTTTDIMKFMGSQDGDSYRMMLENDIRKMLSTAAYALAYQEVSETHGEEFGHRPHVRAEQDYENFLLRVVATRDKAFQLWNAFNNSPLRQSDVGRGKIKEHLANEGRTDDFFDDICAIWDDASATEVVKVRNAVAHKYSLEAIGIGYPIIGRPVQTKSGYKQYNIGKTIGKLDWDDAKQKIKEACDFVIELREVILKHLS